MTKELIKIEVKNISETEVQTVNARELHGFLEVGRDFNTWIKQRIEKYKFVENQDFTIIEGLSSPESGSTKARPQKTIEYYVSIDMAKELSMVENNNKGHEARRYFIECERQLKEVTKSSQFNIPQTFAEALKLAYEQQLLIEEQKPKVEAFDQFLSCKNSITFNEAAKVLSVGRNKLFEFCRSNKLLINGGINHNLPYQKYVNMKLFEVKEFIIKDQTKSQTLVTTKGLEYLRKRLNYG